MWKVRVGRREDKGGVTKRERRRGKSNYCSEGEDRRVDVRESLIDRMRRKIGE